jgi:hypothetical protein
VSVVRASANVGVPSMSIGTVVSLVGGLALVTAYFMPWFAVQNLLLSGSFLARFLASPGDVARFLPGVGGPAEVQLLRALVYLFPTSGWIAVALAILLALRPGRPIWLSVALVLSGVVPLVAVLVGLTRLPPDAALEVGLWQIGIGSVAILLGPWLDVLLARRSPNAVP